MCFLKAASRILLPLALLSNQVAIGQQLFALENNNEECPVLGCCIDDCCSKGTSWDSSINYCVADASSGGFNGNYTSNYEHGCVERICCDADCCGDGAVYDPSEQCCVPASNGYTTYSFVTEFFNGEKVDSHAAVVNVTCLANGTIDRQGDPEMVNDASWLNLKEQQFIFIFSEIPYNFTLFWEGGSWQNPATRIGSISWAHWYRFEGDVFFSCDQEESGEYKVTYEEKRRDGDIIVSSQHPQFPDPGYTMTHLPGTPPPCCLPPN